MTKAEEANHKAIAHATKKANTWFLKENPHLISLPLKDWNDNQVAEFVQIIGSQFMTSFEESVGCAVCGVFDKSGLGVDTEI